MQAVVPWIRRRPYTLGLAAFYVAWYALQMSVFHLAGENVAQWWFYFEQPPRHISPGLLFAPVSHDLYTLTHIGANVGLLLAVGGFAEPYIGGRRILVTVVGLGYLSVYLANLTVLLHRMWVVAGASGGVLALLAYCALRLRRLAFREMAPVPRSWADVETVVAMSLLLSVPVFLAHQTVWIPRPHGGHVSGLLLGLLYYGVEKLG